MRIFKKLTFFCFLFIIPWATADSENRSLIIYQKMESLLKDSCNLEQLNPIIISNDLKDVIFETSLIDEPIPMILIDDNFQANKDLSMFLPEIPTYVLSTSKLTTILQKMKSSSWWNIESRFFIVEDFQQSCNAENIFKVLWKTNLLSSLYVCWNDDDSVVLYTYNPYANYAPYPWQQTEVINNKQGQLALFKLSFDSSDTYQCKSLFFEKTRHLDGSKIIAGGVARPGVTVNYKKVYDISTLNDTMGTFPSKLFTEIFSYLNVTAVIYYTDLNVTAHNQIEMAFRENLTDGTHDIGLNEIFVIEIPVNLSNTNPIDSDKIIIITRPRTTISPLQEIQSTYSVGVLLLTAVVLIITFVVIMLCKRPGFGYGLLEVLRVTLSMSTLSRFYRNSLRIFIASLLIFVVIMNANFQSRMTAYSTKIKKDVANSVADLQNNKYTIYMKPYVKQILGVDDWSDEQKNYVHVVTNESCYRYVIEDHKSTKACIAGVVRNLQIVIKHNLHVAFSKDQRFTNYYVRKDWPLKAKVDRAILWLLESGILRRWQNTEFYEPIKKHKQKEVEILDVYREIIINDLYFIYLTFGICLGIGIIMFVIEIVVDYVRARI